MMDKISHSKQQLPIRFLKGNSLWPSSSAITENIRSQSFKIVANATYLKW